MGIYFIVKPQWNATALFRILDSLKDLKIALTCSKSFNTKSSKCFELQLEHVSTGWKKVQRMETVDENR